MTYSLICVERFPQEIDADKLYWSKEFEISAHRCACGCGDIIYLPIGPVDYSITEGKSGPTLRPSVGNWNVCNAHYFITNGQVDWASPWTPEQIASGRTREDAKRSAYYDAPKPSLFRRLVSFGRKLLKMIWS